MRRPYAVRIADTPERIEVLRYDGLGTGWTSIATNNGDYIASGVFNQPVAVEYAGEMLVGVIDQTTGNLEIFSVDTDGASLDAWATQAVPASSQNTIAGAFVLGANVYFVVIGTAAGEGIGVLSFNKTAALVTSTNYTVTIDQPAGRIGAYFNAVAHRDEIWISGLTDPTTPERPRVWRVKDGAITEEVTNLWDADVDNRSTVTRPFVQVPATGNANPPALFSWKGKLYLLAGGLHVCVWDDDAEQWESDTPDPIVGFLALDDVTTIATGDDVNIPGITALSFPAGSEQYCEVLSGTHVGRVLRIASIDGSDNCVLDPTLSVGVGEQVDVHVVPGNAAADTPALWRPFYERGGELHCVNPGGSAGRWTVWKKATPAAAWTKVQELKGLGDTQSDRGTALGSPLGSNPATDFSILLLEDSAATFRFWEGDNSDVYTEDAVNTVDPAADQGSHVEAWHKEYPDVLVNFVAKGLGDDLGKYFINYTVYHQTVSISPQYSLDKGVTWQACTSVDVADLTGNAPGDHVFAWNAVADLGEVVSLTEVKIRLFRSPGPLVAKDE